MNPNPPREASDAASRSVRELSDRLVELQRPIRVLDAIKWDDGVEEAFFAAGARELPAVAPDYYAGRPLAFDPAARRAAFEELSREIARQLGRLSAAGDMMRRMCGEYVDVLRLLEARGTPAFHDLSRDLYGSATDAFHAGEPTLADLGDLMSEALSSLPQRPLPEDEKRFSSAEAVERLQARLDAAFAGAGRGVRVILADGIVADAAAGSDYLKIRRDARFSERELRTLEVHEGWVHLGTTLNGALQPCCTFLSKGPPSSTITQEGLAILLEIVSFSSHPARLRNLTNRIRAVRMAEQGADFLEVFRFFREQGEEERAAYALCHRVFRGSVPDGRPFTKDLSYTKGFVLTYNFVRLAVKRGVPDRIPMLFCGKTHLGDVKKLSQGVEEGWVAPPRFLPPQIADLSALSAWMCFSNFLNRLDLARVEADYASLL